MRDIDPYRYRETPFVGRPLLEWMDLAKSLAEQSQQRPTQLFELLETEGKPKY
ncbi:hypothetical protein OAS39_12370 [Pirellulales bacterium]|nr:hypothetical protein [Pirellulales bacterium]